MNNASMRCENPSIARCQSALPPVNGRGGLSLLEILIAFALLTGALAALGHQVHVGVTAATRLQDETDAVLRCESLFGLIMSGAQPMTGQGSFEDDSQWTWRSTVKPSSLTGLLELTVSVEHSNPRRTAARCMLRRLVRSAPSDTMPVRSVTPSGSVDE